MNRPTRDLLPVNTLVRLDSTTSSAAPGRADVGIIESILTRSITHPHGIKVRLTSGATGRVEAVISYYELRNEHKTCLELVRYGGGKYSSDGKLVWMHPNVVDPIPIHPKTGRPINREGHQLPGSFLSLTEQMSLPPTTSTSIDGAEIEARSSEIYKSAIDLALINIREALEAYDRLSYSCVTLKIENPDSAGPVRKRYDHLLSLHSMLSVRDIT